MFNSHGNILSFVFYANCFYFAQANRYLASLFFSVFLNSLGPVVQSTISANPGLNFNLLFLFMHFCPSICFKTSEKKTFIGPDKISEEIFPSL